MSVNVQHEIKGDKLVITVDVAKRVLEAAPLSKTGKSRIVASTNGFVNLEDRGLAIGLNVIKK